MSANEIGDLIQFIINTVCVVVAIAGMIALALWGGRAGKRRKP